MLHSPLFLSLFLVLLPVMAAAQPANPTEQLQKRLLKTGQDTNRVKVLLDLGRHYLNRRGEIVADLDSAIAFAQAAYNLSETLKFKHGILNSGVLISLCYVEKNDISSCRTTFMKLIQQYQKTGDKRMEADVLLQIANKTRYTPSLADESIGYLWQALELYRQTGDQLDAIKALKEIADTHLIQGKLEDSENELLEVLDQYKAIGFQNLHYTYDLLAAVATKKGNLDRALFYGMETIKSMEQTGDSASASIFYYRIGRIYAELDHVDKSLQWYKKSCEHGNTSVYTICLAVARDLAKLGKPEEGLSFAQNLARETPPVTATEETYLSMTLGDCYNQMAKYGPAEKHYLEMNQTAELLDPENELKSMANFSLGSFYLRRKRYREAGLYLNRVLEAPPGVVAMKRLINTHYLLFKLDSLKGDFIGAIQHFQLNKQLNDSIFSINKSKQIEELQIKYDTEKKTKELILLQNETVQQQGRLRQASLTTKMAIGVGALLFIILGLLYNRSRLRRITNARLELQQVEINRTNRTLHLLVEEKERLLREIHHRVKNNLQIVMSLLNSQSAYLENNQAIEAIRESQQRIHSISLIHQKLYQSEGAAIINMDSYIRELVEYLQSSFNTGLNIRFDLQIEPIQLDVTQAVPVGLILNEAISNAIKYAFPGKNEGLVRISMQGQSANRVVLIVQDNGVGLKSGFDIDQSKSLGMTLMRGLSEQLNGHFILKNDNGLAICCDFEISDALE